jgi:hypothetical protein
VSRVWDLGVEYGVHSTPRSVRLPACMIRYNYLPIYSGSADSCPFNIEVNVVTRHSLPLRLDDIMSLPIADVFEATLTDFKARLTLKELKDFEIISFQDVQKTILHIQDVQETKKSMMHMIRIQSFLEAMNEFSKVVEIFLNVSNFVAFIWGPMKFMLQVRSTQAFHHSFRIYSCSVAPAANYTAHFRWLVTGPTRSKHF